MNAMYMHADLLFPRGIRIKLMYQRQIHFVAFINNNGRSGNGRRISSRSSYSFSAWKTRLA